MTEIKSIEQFIRAYPTECHSVVLAPLQTLWTIYRAGRLDQAIEDDNQRFLRLVLQGHQWMIDEDEKGGSNA